MVRIYLRCGRPRFDLWARKIPWRTEWQHAPVFFCLDSPGKRIPWTEDPQRIPILQSMGSQRVRRDWVTNTFTFKENNICLDIQPAAMKRTVLPLNSQLSKQMITSLCKGHMVTSMKIFCHLNLTVVTIQINWILFPCWLRW